MPKKRQLAAILFADIMGYTALMQEDENIAREAVQKFRTAFKEQAAQYDGKIVQFYGDGCLVIFNSAVDALSCATSLQRIFQKEPQVPVRMGIHSGDVFYEDDNVFGDSVNLASRIESGGIPGAVLFSETIQRNIKNQPEFNTSSLGKFIFKNVEHPMEVFALEAEGLVVPKREELSGKLKPYTGPPNIWKDLWNRGIPQMLAGYILAAYVLLKFLEWILNRYQLSPYWTDVGLTIFLAMIPSVVFYIWNRERIRRGQLSLTEKLALPANFLAAFLLAFFLFRGTELGAINQIVSIEDENGILIEQLIVKPEFKKRLLIFPFQQEEPDSSSEWLKQGLSLALWLDLDQDRFLTVRNISDELPLREMIEVAERSKMNFFLTGTFSNDGDVLSIILKIYDLKEGKFTEESRFIGSNPLEMVDRVSLSVRQDLGLSSKQLKESLDLPFGEAFTKDTTAFRYLVLSKEPDALRQDSNFVLAAYYYADRLNQNQHSDTEAKRYIDKAMEQRKRLPSEWEMAIQSLYYQVHDRPEKATALLELQSKLNPDNLAALSRLRDWYAISWQLDKLIQIQDRIVGLNPEPLERVRMAKYYLLKGNFTEAEIFLERVLNEDQENINALNVLADVYLNQGQYAKVKGILNRMAFIAPESEALLEPVFEHLAYTAQGRSLPDTDKLPGIYRQDNSSYKQEVVVVNGQLYIKPVNKKIGLFAYPYAASSFGSKHIDEQLQTSYRLTFFTDTIVMQLHQEFNKETSLMEYYWKQDSSIWTAEQLLMEDKIIAALDAYRSAYAANPGHYYLREFIRHLEYVLEQKGGSSIQSTTLYEGNDGDVRVFNEQGKPYLQIGNMPRMQMYPLSANRFLFLEQYNLQIEVVVSGGQVTRITPFYYNRYTSTFEKSDTFIL